MIKVEDYAHQVDMSPPKISTNMKGTSITSNLLRKWHVHPSLTCMCQVSAILCFVDAVQSSLTCWTIFSSYLPLTVNIDGTVRRWIWFTWCLLSRSEVSRTRYKRIKLTMLCWHFYSNAFHSWQTRFCLTVTRIDSSVSVLSRNHIQITCEYYDFATVFKMAGAFVFQ